MMWCDVIWCDMMSNGKRIFEQNDGKKHVQIMRIDPDDFDTDALAGDAFFAFSLREIRDWDSIHPRMEHDIMQLCHVDFRWNHTSEISGNWYNDIFFYVSWYLWHHMDAWVINEWYCIPNEVRKLGWMSKKHTCMVYVFKPLHCIPSMFYGISWHHPEAQQCRTL